LKAQFLGASEDLHAPLFCVVWGKMVTMCQYVAHCQEKLFNSTVLKILAGKKLFNRTVLKILAGKKLFNSTVLKILPGKNYSTEQF